MQESETDINTPLSPDNSAVLKHIDMYQGIIDRMASNSSACKNWCIVLVSAFLAFIVKDGHYDIAWIVSVPIIIFCFLDSYYLGLEQQFRDAFKASTKKIRNNTFMCKDLFVVKPSDSILKLIFRGFASWATGPLYMGLLSLILLVVWK